jgi:acetyl esterase/lipase
MSRTTRWLLPSLLLAWSSAGSAQPPDGPEPSLSLPENVRVEKDLNYAGTRNPRQALDLVLPRANRSGKPLPMIVIIHGGAFRAGNKSMGLREAAGFAGTGDYAAATINYRLSGEATWPAQIHDCKAAIRWLRANAAKYGLDPDRIGVIGASAGGHLAAMLGAGGGVAALEGDLGPHTGVSSRVKCVVDLFGPSDLLAMADYPSRIDHNAPHSPESELIGGALPEHKDAARAASPITYISHDDPPFLIFHGTEDPLVPFNQSERLTEALKAAGVSCAFVRVIDASHGDFRSPEVGRRVRQFFDKHLRDQRLGEVSDAPISRSPAKAKAKR